MIACDETCISSGDHVELVSVDLPVDSYSVNYTFVPIVGVVVLGTLIDHLTMICRGSHSAIRSVGQWIQVGKGEVSIPSEIRLVSDALIKKGPKGKVKFYEEWQPRDKRCRFVVETVDA